MHRDNTDFVAALVVGQALVLSLCGTLFGVLLWALK